MDMPVFNIEKTCFFAGHRPYKFTYEPEQEERFLTTLKNSINKTVREAFDNGYDTFLCGGAIGFDIMCAESVIELKKKFPQVRLVCMLPFENHHNSFPAEWQTRFTDILDACDFIDYVSPDYVTGCYYDRNHNMIKNSSLLITFFDGKGGGTARVVAAAQSAKLKITNLYDAPPVPENITFFVGYDSDPLNIKPNRPNSDNK
ncbi:MAG: DUF1273 family protein [Clostridia bacterium]|nr:DUF1273 family protein [Clostridia bacterium]